MAENSTAIVEATSSETTKSNSKTPIIVVSALAGIALAALIAVLLVVMPAQKQAVYDEISEAARQTAYQDAVQLANDGKYADALAAFDALGDYEDSADYREKFYQEAQEAFQAQDYAKAHALWTALDGYKESLDELDNLKYYYLEIGDTVEEGNYNGDPILWRVIGKDGDRVLLITEYVIDAKAFNDWAANVTWESCTLRAYLNEEEHPHPQYGWDMPISGHMHFMSGAAGYFVPLDTYCASSENPHYAVPGGSATTDTFFLLSYEEVRKYMPTEESRRAYPTPRALSNGIRTDEQGYASWWLRTPGVSAAYTCNIFYNGEIMTGGTRVQREYRGLRPAVWVLPQFAYFG